MKVYSQLIAASLENLAADPALLPLGRFFYRTDTNKIRVKLSAGLDTVVCEDLAATLTNKSIDADTNTITNIENADIKAAAAIAVNKLAALTANRAVITDGSGFASASAVTNTEVGYLTGVTSAIQTQMNTKVTNPMTTGGDLIYGGASGVPTRLANGTLNQILKSTGGTTAPAWTSAIMGDVQTKTTTYTALVSDGLILASASGGAWTLTWPTAVGNTGKLLVVKKTDTTTNAITVSGTGLATFKLAVPNSAVGYMSDGTNWFKVFAYGDNNVLRVRRSTAATAITGTTGIAYDVIWNTVDNDPLGGFSSTTYTFAEAGFYRLNASICWAASATTAGFRAILFVKNGPTTISQKRPLVWNASAASLTASQNDDVYYFAVGDTIKVQALQNSGATIGLEQTDANVNIENVFTICKVG
jgi:hypothetical protein